MMVTKRTLEWHMYQKPLSMADRYQAQTAVPMMMAVMAPVIRPGIIPPTLLILEESRGQELRGELNRQSLCE